MRVTWEDGEAELTLEVFPANRDDLLLALIGEFGANPLLQAVQVNELHCPGALNKRSTWQGAIRGF